MPRLALDPDARRILIRAKLIGPLGKRLIPMILDTGASITTISHEVALAIGCDPAKTNLRTEIMTASSVESVPLIVLPAIEVLGQRVERLEAVCHDLPAVSPVVGLLGLNFLRQFDLHVNFRPKTLELIR